MILSCSALSILWKQGILTDREGNNLATELFVLESKKNPNRIVTIKKTGINIIIEKKLIIRSQVTLCC